MVTSEAVEAPSVQPKSRVAKSAGSSRAKSSDHNVGKVLRSVYQTAVQEEIPIEMLDLLNKLD